MINFESVSMQSDPHEGTKSDADSNSNTEPSNARIQDGKIMRE